nr:putative E3 ubiquitin-protein ligase RF298 [Ipomoea batatas]
MVNPNAAGGGREGNNNGDNDKGKGKIDTSNSMDRDGIPFLPPIYYEKYERLAESLHKQLLEVQAWKERSVKEAEGGDNSWEQRMMEVERECVMCLSVEKTVAFLPCAHLALCQDCNVVHQRLGMNDCPTCRTPINKRITVRFPPPLTK